MGSFSKITPQILLKKVKRRLGAKALTLSFSDEELMDIFYEETLPIFSIYFPANYSFKVDLTSCKKAPIPTAGQQLTAYTLDLPYGMNVIEVEDINFYYSNIRNSYVPGSYGFEDAYDIFNNQVMNGLIDSMMQDPPIWEFREPNILIVEDAGYCVTTNVVIVELCITHAKDLSTLRFSYLEYITKLFVLDCKIALYEDMKHSDKIDATFNQIDLKIDDWANAEQERKELLSEWDHEFLAHRRKTVYRG